MITVLRANKLGNRIVSYTCNDGSKTANITKDQLIGFINQGIVKNAKIQVYNGTTIIRIKDNITEYINEKASTFAGDTTDKQSKSNGIVDYIIEARNKGIKSLDLTGLIVDTKTFQVSKKQSADIKSSNTESVNYENKIKEVIQKQLNYGVYCGMYHNRYGIAKGNTGHKIGVYLIDGYSGVYKLIKEYRGSRGDLVVTPEYFVTFEFVSDWCDVTVYRVTSNGSISQPFSDSIEEFTSAHSLVTKLSDGYIMITGREITAVLDLNRMILSCGKRTLMLNMFDISSDNSYVDTHIHVDNIKVQEIDDYVSIRLRTSLKTKELGTVNGKYKGGHNVYHLADGVYIKLKVYSDSRGVQTEIIAPGGTYRVVKPKVFEPN